MEGDGRARPGADAGSGSCRLGAGRLGPAAAAGTGRADAAAVRPPRAGVGSGAVGFGLTARMAYPFAVPEGDPAGWVLIGLLATLSAITLALGWGLGRRKRWARTGAIALCLCWIPIGVGTVMTLFTLWTLLFSEGGRAGFELPEGGDSVPSLD